METLIELLGAFVASGLTIIGAVFVCLIGILLIGAWVGLK